MYTPGTIKAIGLMSKGVSSDKAFAEGRNIDMSAAQTRVNFYTEQSLRAGNLMTLPSPSASTNISTPGVASNSPVKVSNPSSSTTVSKTYEDMVSGGYKRNTGDGSYLANAPGMMPTPVATGSQKKIKTFYDTRFMPNPKEEVEIDLNIDIDPTNFISKSLFNNGWGIKNQQDKLNAAADNLAKSLSATVKSSDVWNIISVDQIAADKKQEDQNYLSIKNTALAFLNSKTPEELNKNKKILDKQIQLKMDEYTSSYSLSEKDKQTYTQSQLMNIAEEKSRANGGIANTEKIKLEGYQQAIKETYKQRIFALEGQKTLAVLKDGYNNSTDKDSFLKSLDSYKNKAGGLINLNSNITNLLKTANPDDYLDRPLTEADIKLGGAKVLNEQALMRLNENTALSGYEEQETSYNATKDHLIESHASIGQGVSNLLYSENINLVKRQQQLVKLSEKPDINREKLKELDSEYKSIQKQVETNNKILGKVQEIHDFKNIKNNEEIKNFAGDFIEDLEKNTKKSKEYYDKEISGFDKGSWVTGRTLLKLFSGAGKLGTETIGGLGAMTGLDGVATFGRRLTNYINVDALVNFDVVNNRGQYQTSDDYIFTDNEGNKRYQGTALLYQGAEMAPLVASMMFAGSGAAGGLGRIINASSKTLVGRGLMSAQRAAQFNSALATTGSYAKAFTRTMAKSNNGYVRFLGTQVPNAIGLGAVMYPQEFGRTYRELYEKGIDNAVGKAHAITAMTTGIEMLSEGAFPDIKYLDDFAEQGVLGKSWVGSFQQYRTVYGSIFKDTFSPKTLDYLATRSLNFGGKVGAVGRFMVSRGFQEGGEEVAAELMNHFADNHMGFAGMRGEQPKELNPDELLTAFAGSFVSYPFGAGRQVKAYNENRKYGQMFDIMVNAQYYKNRINEEFKAGKISTEKATIALSKIQELETIEKEYGVRNVKNLKSTKQLEDISELMEDAHVQFDYFKNILTLKGLDAKLNDVEKGTYSEDEKNQLLASAEEANKTIADYKRRSDFYTKLTQDDKRQVLDKSIKTKLRLSRLDKTESLEELNTNLDNYAADVQLNKRPTYFVESVGSYRDEVQKIREERKQAEQDAIASGTYNPLVDALENKTPTTSTNSIQNQEELGDAIAQAVMAPDRGGDVLAYFNGQYDEQLDALEQESERVTAMFLEAAKEGKPNGETLETQTDGTEQVVPEDQGLANSDAKIADLTPEQQDELSKMLEEINNNYDDILERKQKVAKVLGDAIDAVVPDEILAIADKEAQTEAYTNWVSDLLTKVRDESEAVREVMIQDPALSQGVLYDKVRYLEYKADNKDKIDKKLVELQKIRDERKAAEGVTGDETRNNINTKEKSGETGREINIVVPELIQSDVTPEFAAGLTELENMPVTRLTSTASQAAGDIITDNEYNAQRSIIIQNLLGEVLSSSSLDSALAKMYAIMEAADVSVEDKEKTFELMKRIANSEPVLEEDYTHIFELLLIKADLDLNKLKFTSPVIEVQAPPIVATQVDLRSIEEIQRTTNIPNVQLGTLEGKLVEYNGVRGILNISEGGLITIETENTIYELTDATRETSTLEHMVQEVTNELDSKNSDNIISETEVMLDNNEYLIETDAKGNVTGLRDKKKPQKRITNNKLLIRAEVLRNRLEHQVITDAIETTPEIVDDLVEAMQELPSAQVVENLFAFNMTDNVASAIDKLYEEGNNEGLTEAELLETELWIMDAWYKLDDLAKEYPEDEIFQNAIENLLIINKLLYNGKQRKSTRKAGSKKPAEAKTRRTVAKKEPSKTKSKSPVVKESAKPTQLTLDLSTPTPVEKPKKGKKSKVALPTQQSTPETNVNDTVINNQKVVNEVKVELPKTEDAQSEVQSKNQTLTTTNVKMPYNSQNQDAAHLRIQEKIIQSINKEHRTAKAGIVDFFTMIEQVLGPETLTQMEAIFGEMQTEVTEERKAALRSQFLSLFPSNFIKPSAAAYMFDTQILNNVSQSDLNQVNELNLNASETEIYQLNKSKTIDEVELKDGRKLKNMSVKESNGKLLLFKEDTQIDANGNEVPKKVWVPLDQIKDPTKVFQYPIKGVAPITFNSLNVLTFTMLNAEGKVQKYNNDGDKTESGNKALLIYLPTSKAKANPTPQQQAMSGLRGQLVEGKRVVNQVQLTGPSITKGFITREGDPTPTNGDYEFEYSTENLTPVETSMPPAEIIESKAVEKTITVDTTQSKSVAALESLIAKAKTIPDPSKEGYLIDGERYERQSGFTKRVMGTNQVDTEDSILNMEKGAAVGNLLDIIGRDVLGGRTVKSLKEYIKEAESMGQSLREGKGYKLEFTQEQFDALLTELESVKKELVRKGYKIYTEGLVVYRKYTAEEKAATGFAGVAGAMDIVAIDKDGGVHIIDFKNKKFKNVQTFKSSMYNSNERFPSNISKWGTQQTAYGVLADDFGLPIRSINILAFASQYEESNGVITVNMLSKGTDQVPVLPQNKSEISDAIIRLKYDSKIASQINLRTTKPDAPAPKTNKEATSNLDSIKENVPEFTDSEAKNASIILSLLGINPSNVENGLDSQDENPTTKNSNDSKC